MLFLKVQITFISLHILDVLSLNIQGKGDLPKLSVITNIINTFFRRFDNILTNERRNFRNVHKKELLKMIEDKLSELQPFLEDNDINEIDKIVTDGTVILDTNENTILREKERPMKTNIQNYKKVIEKIKIKLTKESISAKTKDLILKTMEGLIHDISVNNCDWKRKFRSSDSGANIMLNWNREWLDIKKALNYSLLKYKSDTDASNNDFNNFLDNAFKLFSSISEDIDKMPKMRNIRCSFMNLEDKNENILRLVDDKIIRKLNCKYFKVCSLELQDYMINIYENINNTAVSVTRNYAEMYKRDVTLEKGKEPVIRALKRVSDYTETNVTNIFVEETKSLKLDKSKNKDANLAILLIYTQNILTRVKDYLYKALWDEIGLMKNEKVFTINDDIHSNSEVDFQNLKTSLHEKFCNTFQFCNGDYNGRREILTDNQKDKAFVLMNAHNDLTNISRALTTSLPKVKDVVITRTTHV